MNKKKQSPSKGMLIIVFILMFIAFRTHQIAVQEKNQGISSDHYSSPHNFFQYLADLVGLGGFSSSSHGASNGNGPLSGQLGGINSAHQHNQDNLSVTGAAGIDGSDSGQQTNAADDSLGMNAEKNAEIMAANGSQNNAEDNPDNVNNNPGNNPDNNADNNSGDNSGTNAAMPSGNGLGNNSGGGPGDNTGGGPGDNPGGNSGSNSGGSASNLPTLNPIPSDNTVSPDIAQQNQQNASLASILAARQALVVPVQEQAQASKYQTVSSENIPAVSTNQVPSDLIEKVKSNQVAVTH